MSASIQIVAGRVYEGRSGEHRQVIRTDLPDGGGRRVFYEVVGARGRYHNSRRFRQFSCALETFRRWAVAEVPQAESAPDLASDGEAST